MALVVKKARTSPFTLARPRFAGRLRVSIVQSIVISFCLLAASRGAQTDSPQIAYLFSSSGAFLAIDVESGALEAYWTLQQVETTSSLLPPCGHGNFVEPGCNVIFGGLPVANGRLYGVFPSKTVTETANGEIDYQLLVLQLPEMKVAASLPIPKPQPEPPAISVTPDGKRIWVSFRDAQAEAKIPEPSIVSVVEVYDVSTMKRVSSMRESAGIKDIEQLKAVLNVSFGHKAYFSSDGNTLFEGLDATTISGNSMRRRYVNPLEKISFEERSRLKGFEQVDAASQKPWLNYASGDSAAGRTVLRVANATGAAYWTVDLRTGSVSPLIMAPLSIAHLTPDGRTLLLQMAKAIQGNEGASELRAGSQFRLYDVASGKQVGQFENAALGGPAPSGGLLCVSPSGGQAVFADGQKVYVIGLPAGKTLVEFQAQSLDPPRATCTFSSS